MAILSFVVSILSLIFCLVPYVGFILSVAALILAIIVIRSKKNQYVYTRIKKAGVIVSIIAFVLSLFITGRVVLKVLNVTGDFIGDAQTDLINMSNSTKNRIIENWAGKQKTGPEILAFIKQKVP